MARFVQLAKSGTIGVFLVSTGLGSTGGWSLAASSNGMVENGGTALGARRACMSGTAAGSLVARRFDLGLKGPRPGSRLVSWADGAGARGGGAVVGTASVGPTSSADGDDGIRGSAGATDGATMTGG